VHLAEVEWVDGAIVYLNRLSDYLSILSRKVFNNKRTKIYGFQGFKKMLKLLNPKILN
jgi:cob(I)alamin adenosyltransferase